MRAAIALLLAILLGCVYGCREAKPRTPPRSAAPPAGPADEASRTITAGDMQARIAILSHDSLRGRETPSPGLESAAAYIARELAAMGWEPAGDSGTFFQRYPLPGGPRGARPPNVVGTLRGSDST
ncbi:MAG: hypothetical protein ACREON_08875, partial [Gemmatimonadaceae bacterium]